MTQNISGSRFSLKEVFIASAIGTGFFVGLGEFAAPQHINSTFIAASFLGATALTSAMEGTMKYLMGDNHSVYDLPTRVYYAAAGGFGAMLPSIFSS